jgi:hypothetical protein
MLATFADPVRAQAAVGRFTSKAYDLDGTVSRSPMQTSKAPQPGPARVRLSV